MAQYHTDNIRNIALLGHVGSGKTTLLEALLARSGEIPSAGSVDKGTTLTDFDPQEKELGHSLYSSVCSLDFESAHINFLDTPGYPDFIGRALCVLPAADSAAIVINAQAGVEMVTERVMTAARQRNLCRMIIVNKIDTNDLNFTELLDNIQETFGSECLPINLPTDNGNRVVDCFFSPDESLATDFSSVKEAHDAMVDQVVEVDEELMEIYLEQGQALTPEQLHEPFEEALREGHLIPVCFVSAQTGAGIDELLQVFARLMPTPLESNPPLFLKGEGQDAVKAIVEADPEKHAVAHVFKVTVDPYVGRLGIFRIHQGTISPNTQLYIGHSRKPFKVSHLLKLQGKKTWEVSLGIPGDICAVSKVEDIEFDAVLHDSNEEDHYHLKSVEFPPPLYGIAIEPTRRGDEQKLSEALQKLSAEDPSLQIEHRASLNETVMYGMGDMHLKVVLERMKEQFNVEVKTHPPSIAYRETITKPADGHHRHKKQTGGAGQFGEVFLRIAPLDRGKGFEFENKVVGGAIPSQFIPGVEKGIRQVLDSGAIAGYPLQDIRVTVYDGKHHSVDSKEIAFLTAGKKAFLEAVRSAHPVVLEPVVHLRITAPASSLGDITGHLSSSRGMINGSTSLPRNRVAVTALVPMGELEDYQSKLKSMTGGEGLFTMEFSHYDIVPPPLQQKLVSQFKHEE
ncbi:elongation factor G [Hahella sp. CCB-MM4]|uniref:elongation factor G n=1 Tax=Hahella sp. (strain CCB-MM4) TaxID=1926491 RepID=UPI000B9B4EB5|nr:elongation factor G [Hahella sp. CCB-MM4]OZG71810.1 elongation factor G [Hahella sp. CCB-MM4]